MKMVKKLITKSFERLLDKGKNRGFITFEELGKSLGKRGASPENVEKSFHDYCRGKHYFSSKKIRISIK